MTTVGLLVGSASTALGRELEVALAVPTVYAELRTFPDSEFCVRAPLSRAPETVVIVQGTPPPQDRNLQELYQLVDVAISQRCRNVVCVVPYLAYARQDKRTVPGEPFSARIVLQTLAALGASRLITVEVHNQRIFNDAPIDAASLSVTGLFADSLSRLNLHDPVLISPDEGGTQRLRAIGEILGWPILALRKFKNERGHTWYEGRIPQVKGRSVIVIDDLCSSGSTVIPLARHLFECGVGDIHYGVVHFFANPQAILDKIGQPIEIFATDSIPNPTARISLAPVVADFIKNQYIS
ncbi:ribose-phosphate diphosphokinase [Bradyrhizobium japonicum]|uniref:ribose-phosphate diphosphokinase n=1 Tax=Bradyrhizobium japonicum TaxID=375 RepID=UPI00200EA06C|nr:ribose-phosphate diphosphokinase [Bradyrhizobium japonicum]UQE03634.1 ribose-phosphate pyrophosphokinase [Bradyrhizobium japonicum]